MMNKTFSGKDIDKAFGIGLYSTQKYNSGSRLVLFNSQKQQAVIPCKPEIPRWYTGYEYAFGKYSDAKIQARSNYDIIDMIPKFPWLPRHIYTLVLRDRMTGIYDAMEVTHNINYSETHGQVTKPTEVDMRGQGGTIGVGEYIRKPVTIDDDGNYRYGINAKVAQISLSEVEEDGFMISDEFAEKTKIMQMDEQSMLINNNTLLTNLYGDTNDYKSFPDILEDVKDNILCAERQLNIAYASSEMTNKSLTTRLQSDTIVHGYGKVLDINVFVNNEAELSENFSRNQLTKYWVACKMYNQTIARVLNGIIRVKSNNVTFRLRMMHGRAVDFINPKMRFNFNGDIEFAYVKILYGRETSLSDGYKLTDRHGSKGVVCHIVPKDFMPRDMWGNVADIVQNAPSVIGRENTAQMYEQELNFISFHVRKQMVEAADQGIAKQFAIMREFMSIVSEDQCAELEKFWKSMNDLDKQEYILNVIAEGLYIRQGPFDDCVTLEKMDELYTRFGVRPERVRIKKEFLKHGMSDIYITEKKQNNLKNYAFEVNKHGEIEVPLGVTKNEVGKDELNIPGYSGGNTTYVKGQDDEIRRLEADKKGILHQVSKNPNSKSLNDMLKEFWTEETEVIDNGETIVRSYLSRRPVVIGEKYFVILRHVPDGKLSARNLGSTSMLGLPNKPGKQRSNNFTETAVKIGEMELSNLLLRIPPENVFKFLAGVSKNPVARMKIAEKLLYADPYEMHDIDMSYEDIMDDIPTKVLYMYLFCIGVEFIRDDEDDIYTPFDGKHLTMKQIQEIVDKHALLHPMSEEEKI